MAATVNPMASLKRLETSMAHLWSHVETFADEVADAKSDMDDLSESIKAVEECLETLKSDFNSLTAHYVDRQKRGLKIMLDDCCQQAEMMETLLTSVWTGPNTVWSGSSRTIIADLQTALDKDTKGIARVIARKRISDVEGARLPRVTNSGQKTPSMFSSSQSFLETQPIPYSLEDPNAISIEPEYEMTVAMKRIDHTSIDYDHRRNNARISHSVFTEARIIDQNLATAVLTKGGGNNSLQQPQIGTLHSGATTSILERESHEGTPPSAEKLTTTDLSANTADQSPTSAPSSDELTTPAILLNHQDNEDKDPGELERPSVVATAQTKLARAQDLPSFPLQEGEMFTSGGPASLTERNEKPFEYGEPGSIAPNKPAMLAKDYEMDPLWQREGSKRSNLSAGQTLNSKVLAAMITSRDSRADAHRKALRAVSNEISADRRHADRAPTVLEGDGGWPLKAAVSSRVGSKFPGAFTTGNPGVEAPRVRNGPGRIVGREMYGSMPAVAIEAEERNRNDTLRASAVAMAQKMYEVQQNVIQEAKEAKKSPPPAARETAVRSVPHPDLSEPSRATSEEEIPLNQYSTPDEDHAESPGDYGQNKSPISKITLRARRRASSDGQSLSDDEEAARRVRSQMSIFTSKLAEVDSKKHQNDRDNLMAAAHRNVTARMISMDEKVSQETRKQTPQAKQLQEAETRRQALNQGKVHIGGGRYLDQSEVEAIARARLQPTLADISDKAERQRARDEEIRLEQERIKRDAEAERAQQAQIKAENKAREAEEKRAPERGKHRGYLRKWW